MAPRRSSPRDPGPGRFQRQLLLKEVGQAGQRRLAKACALVVGCGGLGASSANLLARAGVGRLVLVDSDSVELSNLHRQVLYDMIDLGRPKARAAAERLKGIDPDINVRPVVRRVGEKELCGLLKGIDIVLDGTDSMASRRAVNKACCQAGVPWVYGGAAGTTGMAMLIVPRKTPCLECVFPRGRTGRPVPTKVIGVLGPIPDLVGSVQATLAIRQLVGMAPASGLMVLDPWYGVWRMIRTARRRDCPVCGRKPPTPKAGP